MQMALAVNSALMALMKKGIFCTEPYRVQFAGKVSHCLFDKTGTLTTDQLVPAGVLCNNADHTAMIKKAKSTNTPPTIEKVNAASDDVGMVIAACHSLVFVEGPGMVGDPIELAGLDGVGWDYNADKQIAKPGAFTKLDNAIETIRQKADNFANDLPVVNASGEPLTAAEKVSETANRKGSPDYAEFMKKIGSIETEKETMKIKVAKTAVKEVQIVHRHHFSSKLQRMSVISKVTGDRSGYCCLVKGSPEAIGTLLAPGSKPSWYDDAHMLMAEKGMRVLSMAYKWVNSSDTGALAKQSRDWVEADLTFAGFIAFECKNRADSGIVVNALQESAHTVGMLTGDAPLTALHVAHTLGIADPKKIALKLAVNAAGTECGWEGAIGESRGLKVPFTCPGLAKLSETYDLITTEDDLLACAAVTGDIIWKEVDSIHVFARMSPQGKATVIRMMQEHKQQHVLMCGDGGNDVGALKQADCGLALLGGYGAANTEDPDADDNAKGGGGEDGVVASNEDKLNHQIKSGQEKDKKIRALITAHMTKKRGEIQAKQQQWVQEAVANGEGWMAAIKKCTGRMQEELKKEQMLAHKKFGSTYTPKKDALTEALGEGDAMDSVLPVVRPGDASVAAPFTTRVPSVRSVVDLIRQGRCTLLSALQQQQIMMLQCIVSAYTLSAISLEGARSSERQMMASSWLILTASLAFSYSTPIDKMSPVRPIKSLFHPAIFISMLGQAVIHLVCMVYAVRLATETMGPKKLAEVVAFNKAVRAGEDVSTGDPDEEPDPWAEMASLWAKPFMPNLMNTVIFLVETAQIMAILLVNYKGRPWMKGVIENHALCLSLFITIAALIVCAWGVSPQLNTLIHLEEFPDDAFRWQVIALVMVSLFGTFIWDRIITSIFAPEIFKAMMDEAKQTSIADVVPVFTTMFKVIAGVSIFASGNPIIWIGAAWYWWRNRAK